MKEESIYLRKASKTDVRFLFMCVNDPATRESAFDSHIISYEEHTKWFNRLLDNPSERQYILMRNNSPIGQIRITIEGEEGEIDYSISPLERGKGYGKKIINLLIDEVKSEYPQIKRIVGRVKSTNTASKYCFTNNGFREVYSKYEYKMD